jgi:hypothetical protein
MREEREKEREEGEEGGATNYTTVRHDRSGLLQMDSFSSPRRD